jgi:hypothetical protein
MKKFLISVMILFYALSFSAAMDATGDAKKFNKIEESMVYDSFLLPNIGLDIVVNIIQSDTEISGVLVSVHKDGIVIKTLFSSIYIPKSSIGYVKTKPAMVKK